MIITAGVSGTAEISLEEFLGVRDNLLEKGRELLHGRGVENKLAKGLDDVLGGWGIRCK